MNFFTFLFYLLLTINVVLSTCLLVSKSSQEKKESYRSLKSEVSSDFRQLKF